MSLGRSLFRIAHVSDLHVLSPAGTEWRRLVFNKRITGHANLLWQRGRVYRRGHLVAVLEEVAVGADHVVVTGDITNLSLESEYEAARELLDDLARRIEVTVVPGNHDIYLPATLRDRRFWHHFSSFLRSDLPQFACNLPAGRYPCVKLRGPAAIIALSSAVPRPPFFSAGLLGGEQIHAFAQLLAHPEVKQRTPVILVHHPPVDTRPALLRLRDGLVDAAPLREALDGLSRGLVLYGHTHVRVRCRMKTRNGSLDVVSASGAALDHPSHAVRAGFNRYDISDDGSIADPCCWVFGDGGGAFRPIELRPYCL